MVDPFNQGTISREPDEFNFVEFFFSSEFLLVLFIVLTLILYLNRKKIIPIVKRKFAYLTPHSNKFIGLCGAALVLLPILNPNRNVHLAVMKQGGGYFSAIVFSKFLGIPFGVWMSPGFILIFVYLRNLTKNGLGK